MAFEIPESQSSREFADWIVEVFEGKGIDATALGEALIFAGATVLTKKYNALVAAGYCKLTSDTLRDTGELPQFKPPTSTN
jgi:hypothetical protein